MRANAVSSSEEPARVPILLQPTIQYGYILGHVCLVTDANSMAVIPVGYCMVIIVVYATSSIVALVRTGFVRVLVVSSPLPRHFIMFFPSKKTAFGILKLFPAFWALVQVECHNRSRRELYVDEVLCIRQRSRGKQQNHHEHCYSIARMKHRYRYHIQNQPLIARARPRWATALQHGQQLAVGQLLRLLPGQSGCREALQVLRHRGARHLQRAANRSLTP